MEIPDSIPLAEVPSFGDRRMTKQLMSLISALLLAGSGVAGQPAKTPQYQSAFVRVELAPDQPAFVALSVDSLGKSKLSVNPLRPPAKADIAYELRQLGTAYEYRRSGMPPGTPPAWAFELAARQIRLRSRFVAGSPPPPLVLNFNPHLNHATLLGLINEDGSVRLPALLHLPDLGTLRITSSVGQKLALGYDALRYVEPEQANDYVRVTFPAASAAMPQVDYNLEVVAIHPGSPELARDARFDGFRRNWLNIFQLNPRLRVLANHAASDPCAFTVFEYSSVAVRTPPLAPGLTALDLIHQTLGRYLSGMKAYGMAGYIQNDPTTRFDYLDTYPSLLIAAADYVRGSKDSAWLKQNYEGLKDWATKMLAMDVNGDGLLEYPASGDSGSWPEQIAVRPANWWDTIGFGHQDAYSNALAYHALIELAELARQASHPEDVQLYSSRADKIRSAYFGTFYNPETGVLAGWRSADGKLHDYYFTFVSGVAITYGLVPPDKANPIMDRLLAKMHEMGYMHFEYGLPGNLIPITRADSVTKEKRWGGPEKEDGSDGFQIYENGGATASYVYFTLKALYKLGRGKEADEILFPLLAGFEQGGFQGVGPNGLTYDWKAWDGTPHGYEGLLVDGYQALLAVLAR
jgi:hypothetical protein